LDPGGTSCASVTIQNVTTAETCAWDNALAATSWLKFDSVTGNVYTSTGSGGAWTKSNVNVTGFPPAVYGSCVNQFSLTGVTDSTGLGLTVTVSPLGF